VPALGLIALDLLLVTMSFAADSDVALLLCCDPFCTIQTGMYALLSGPFLNQPLVTYIL
jgi:hypothetical protein